MFAAGSTDEWREYEEIWDHYVLQHESYEGAEIFTQAKRQRGVPSYSNMEWDEIDASLAAKLRFGRIHSWARDHEVRWASCLEQLLPSYVPPLREPPTSVLSNVRTASWLDVDKVRELRGTLFRTKAPAGAHSWVPCGLNGVPKMPKNVLRVIFDARRANELYAPRPEKLILFTLEALVHATTVYRYVTTVDYRHYYYQFPLPERLAWLFKVTAGGESFWPRVLPMGWREAVCIAQAATWVIVLHHEKGEAGLEEKYGLRAVDVERTFALRDMPAFYSLRRGDTEIGRIFVLLDGVLVACADAALRDRWAARLRRNEDHFHAVRKEQLNADLGRPGHTAEFAGVVFSEEGWAPRATLLPGRGSAHTAPTRQVASRLGSLLWAIGSCHLPLTSSPRLQVQAPSFFSSEGHGVARCRDWLDASCAGSPRTAAHRWPFSAVDPRGAPFARAGSRSHPDRVQSVPLEKRYMPHTGEKGARRRLLI